MDICFANSNSPSSESDQWLMNFPLLPGGNWSTPYACSVSASHTQLQSIDCPFYDACSSDMTEGFPCDILTCPKDLGLTCYEAAPLGSDHKTLNLTHKEMEFHESAKPFVDRSMIMNTPRELKPGLILQDSTGQHRRSFISSDKADQDVCHERKKAHSQVERRYRANLNARFKQLEDAIKQETATAGADVKSARGWRPGRKSLILQNAYDRIVSLQSELQTLQKVIATL